VGPSPSLPPWLKPLVTSLTVGKNPYEWQHWIAHRAGNIPNQQYASLKLQDTTGYKNRFQYHVLEGKETPQNVFYGILSSLN